MRMSCPIAIALMAHSQIGRPMADNSHRILGSYRAVLGEGPLWDHRSSRLIWCDILGQLLLFSDRGEKDPKELKFADGITSIGLAGDNHYIATSHRRVLLLDAQFNVAWTSDVIEPDMPDNRFNDGKVDPLGRFWTGSMEKECTGRAGSFYILDQTGLRRLDGGYGCTNGPAFSPDGEWVFFTDSNELAIYRNPLSAYQSLNRGVPFIKFRTEDGTPDGMTFDARGRLYVGHFGGRAISRFMPDGSFDRRFAMPATNITSVAFGGSDYATLFATSAHCTFAEADLGKRQMEGALFAINVDATGLPEPIFIPPKGLI